MSEIIDASGNPIEPEETQEKPQEQEILTEDTEATEEELSQAELPELECGYVVGIKPNAEFIFEVIGTKPGLIQLMGLHEFARHKLEVARDMNQRYGVPLLAQQLGQTLQILKIILNMLTQQSKDSLLK